MLSVAGFFYFIYVFIHSIGTYMQNFNNIGRQRTILFSFKNLVHCFLCQTVLTRYYSTFEKKYLIFPSVRIKYTLLAYVLRVSMEGLFHGSFAIF